MVNPGAFQGSRKEWLLAQKEAYKQAVEGGYTNDCITDIQCRYLKRYPIDLAHDEEPSEEHLASIDDNAAEPEPEVPDGEAMDGEAYVEAMKSFEKCHKHQLQKGVLAAYSCLPIFSSLPPANLKVDGLSIRERS